MLNAMGWCVGRCVKMTSFVLRHKGTVMETLASLYNDHGGRAAKSAREVLERNKLDALLIHSGNCKRYF